MQEENSKCGPPPGSDENINTIYVDENKNTLYVDLKKSVKNQFSDVLHRGEHQKPDSENRKIDANVDRRNWRPKGRTARKYAAASLIIENVLRARKFRDCRTLSDSSSPTKMDDSTVQSATNPGENSTPTPEVRNETPSQELQTPSTTSQQQSCVEKEPAHPETGTPPKTPIAGHADSDDRSEDDASTQSEEHSHPNQTPSPINLKPTRGPDEAPTSTLSKASKAVVDAVVQAVVATTSKIDLDAKPPAELTLPLTIATSPATTPPTTTATPERAQERALSTPAVKMPSKSIADLIDGVLTDDEDSSELFDHGNNQDKNGSKDSPNHAGATGEFDKIEGEDFSWDADSEDDGDGVTAQPPQNELEMYVNRTLHDGCRVEASALKESMLAMSTSLQTRE